MTTEKLALRKKDRHSAVSGSVGYIYLKKI